MNTLFDQPKTLPEQYIEPLRREARNERLAEALGRYLEQHGEVAREYLHSMGLPKVGRFGNPGQPIHMLRKAGWHIATERRGGTCWYRLISKPQSL